jgi:hypothetical protein
LINRSGQPISGARIEIIEHPGRTPARVLGSVLSGPDGSFSADVPPGPSRVLQAAYRAFGGDSAYSALAQVSETVTAGIRFAVTPRRAGANGRIALSGRVLGEIPRSGVVVDLLVRYRGAWEPFRTPRTDRDGRFRVSYQFQGAVGRFPFRAEVLGGQVGFPYVTGVSRAVAVATR